MFSKSYRVTKKKTFVIPPIQIYRYADQKHLKKTIQFKNPKEYIPSSSLFGVDFSTVRVHSDSNTSGNVLNGSENYKTHLRSTSADVRQVSHIRSYPQLYRLPTNPGNSQILGITAKKQTTNHRKVSISDKVGPEAAKTCSPAQLQQLKPVLERAKSMSHKAFFRLQALLLGSLPQSSVELQLRNHFHIESKSDKAGKVLDVLRNIYTRLNGTLRFVCTSPKDKNCEQFGAYVTKSHREIFLCPSFFINLNTADHQSPWFILHEAAHLSGAGSDHAYFFTFGGAPTCDDFSPLTTEAAIVNADSYANFAYCVSR